MFRHSAAISPAKSHFSFRLDFKLKFTAVFCVFCESFGRVFSFRERSGQAYCFIQFLRCSGGYIRHTQRHGKENVPPLTVRMPKIGPCIYIYFAIRVMIKKSTVAEPVEAKTLPKEMAG